MHIVFVTTELATEDNSSGGLASFTANIARVFKQQGHDVSVVVVRTKEEEFHFDQGINLYITNVKKEKWEKINAISKIVAPAMKENVDEVKWMLLNLYKGTQVRKLINKVNAEKKIDIVHYCNHGGFNLWAKRSIPYVVRVSAFLNVLHNGANKDRGDVEYKNNPLSVRDRLEEYTVKKSKYVITPSNLFASICKKELGVSATVIETPFVLNKNKWNYTIYNNSIQNKKYILHYGVMRYFKGTHVVAQIVEKILADNPDLYIVLAGGSNEMADENGNSIKAHELVIKSAGMYKDRVIYVGKLLREQLYPIIEKAELCILPSRFENLSNACIESMAMGKIVVATNGASFEQLIDDGKNGFLCELDNPDSFLDGVTKVLKLSDEEKEKMCQNAQRSVERLRPECIYEQYLKYYENAISSWQS